ncbi:MAG: competence/damage-inducible protein A [Clostridia bacterium]|nr:competence/damage-inducible protein A [Clostridia bacterium]
MNAEIIAVGTEILLGDIVNTNAQYIARGLSNLGINVYFQTVVGDNPARLESCLNLAKERADIIITTGGLGPTYDDLTKETIAKNFGRSMVLDQDSYDTMASFFQKMGRTMTENNKKQAMMPQGAIILKNPNGTAPGCIIEGEDNKIAIMMPGPPREMKPMFDDSVIPYLRKFANDVIVSKTMCIIGMGESTLEHTLHDMIGSMENPTVAPYAKDAECTLRVTAKAKTEEEAVALIDPVIEKIKGIIGNVVYGVDVPSLADHIVELLSSKKKTVAFAESCTGGLLSKRITDIPGSSEVFHMGVVAYENSIKTDILGVRPYTLQKYGAVSPQCAIEMAHGIYNLSRSSYGVGITGIAGPGGGTPDKPVGLCYIAVYDGKKTWLKTTTIQRSRDYVRYSVSNTALDMVRHFALNDQDDE